MRSFAFASSSPVLLFCFVALVLSHSVNAAQSTKPKTHNAKQAAALQVRFTLSACSAPSTAPRSLNPRVRAYTHIQAAAVHLQPASYTFTNVATRQKLIYIPIGNHIYPASSSPAAKMSVSAYTPDRRVPWLRLHFGSKNKCLSSAWGGVDNDSAVAYVCASGSNAKKTTLERTKQWWIAVPVSAPVKKTSTKEGTYANAVLLAAQSDSIKTRNAKIKAQEAAFKKKNSKRGLGEDDMAMRARHRTRARTISKRALERRAKTAGAGSARNRARRQCGTKLTSGLFQYAEPTTSSRLTILCVSRLPSPLDSLIPRARALTCHHFTQIDMPARALTGKVYKARGIKSTGLSTWKKVSAGHRSASDGSGQHAIVGEWQTDDVVFCVSRAIRTKCGN